MNQTKEVGEIRIVRYQRSDLQKTEINMDNVILVPYKSWVSYNKEKARCQWCCSMTARYEYNATIINYFPFMQKSFSICDKCFENVDADNYEEPLFYYGSKYYIYNCSFKIFD